MFLSAPTLCQFQRGDHCCVFYQNDESLFATLVPYLLEGLRQNERCFCAQRPEWIGKLLYRLSKAGVNVPRALNRGALEIHPYAEVYGPAHEFRPEPMVEMLEKSIDSAIQQGFSGLRTAGDLFWARESAVSNEKLCEYEALVEEAFAGRPVVGLCQYPVAEFSGDTLEHILTHHNLGVREVSPRNTNLTFNLGEYFLDVIVPKTHVNDGLYFSVHARSDRSVLVTGTAANVEEAMALARTAIAAQSSNRRRAR